MSAFAALVAPNNVNVAQRAMGRAASVEYRAESTRGRVVDWIEPVWRRMHHDVACRMPHREPAAFSGRWCARSRSGHRAIVPDEDELPVVVEMARDESGVNTPSRSRALPGPRSLDHDPRTPRMEDGSVRRTLGRDRRSGRSGKDADPTGHD